MDKLKCYCTNININVYTKCFIKIYKLEDKDLSFTIL